MDCQYETDLETLIQRPRPSPQRVAAMASRFLRIQGEPADLAHYLVAMKALDDLWEQKHVAQG